MIISLKRLFLLISLYGCLIGPALGFEDELPPWLDEHEVSEYEEIPKVLTATRLLQPQTEVPGSVTLIEREDIESLAIRNLTDIFYLVPGMVVNSTNSPSEPVLTYHGTHAEIARRMQVLIDGRSVYKPGLSTVNWNSIPVAIEDIERIEVIRGPNAASYGANAFLGIINFITRDPQDSPRGRVKFSRGNNGIQDAYVSTALTEEDFSFRFTGAIKQDSGFGADTGNVSDTGLEEDIRQGDEVPDDHFQQFINLSSTYELDRNSVIDTQLGLGKSIIERNFAFNTPSGTRFVIPGEIEESNIYLYSRWTKTLSANHEIYVQAYYSEDERIDETSICLEGTNMLLLLEETKSLYEHNPALFDAVLSADELSSGGQTSSVGEALVSQSTQDSISQLDSQLGIDASEADIAAGQAFALRATDLLSQSPNFACGKINESINERRYDIEVQDTLRLNQALRLVSGFSYRHDEAESKSRYNGTINNDIYRLFTNVEYRPFKSVLLNSGFMVEQDTLTGYSLSPRLAVNYLITTNQSLRAVLSRGVRSPDMFEQRVDWSLTIEDLDNPNLTPEDGAFFQTAKAPRDLRHEKILSRELGYYGNFLGSNLAIDVKIFNDFLSNLISEPLQLADFEPSNDTSITLKGAEFQIDYRLSGDTRFYANAAYVENSASNDVVPERFEARSHVERSYFLMWQQKYASNLASSLSYKRYLPDMGPVRLDQLELVLSKSFNFRTSKAKLQWVLRRLYNNYELDFIERNYSTGFFTYLSGEVRY